MIMSLLGRTLKNERDRTIELGQARDALFAEMEVARQIQTLLLPRAPVLPENVVTGKMLTATEVGGDYYDVIQVGGLRSLVAVGDVSGHGVTSGLTMMMVRASLLGALEMNPSSTLSQVYRVLNRCLCQNLERMGVQMYMTLALIEYHGGGRFTAVGRHLPIVIYRKNAQRLEEIEVQGVWLGILDDLQPGQLPELSFSLEPGDLLVLYTDGIVEHAANGQMYGFERLARTVSANAHLGSEGLIDAVLTDVQRYSTDRQDDMTMLVIDHRGLVTKSHANPPS
jgi:serine phosphatase RsbU (regulator of sigma subunit)